MKRATQFLLFSLSIAALLLQGGCAGYQIGSVKPTVYKDINNIYVPPFENLSLEPRASVLVTNAVLKRMQEDGTYAVSTKANADAILVGSIDRIERRQLRAVRNNTLKTREFNIMLVINWALHDPVTGKKIAFSESEDLDNVLEGDDSLKARPGRVIGRTVQFLDPNFQLSERNAIPIAAQDAAEQLVSQLSEGW